MISLAQARSILKIGTILAAIAIQVGCTTTPNTSSGKEGTTKGSIDISGIQFPLDAATADDEQRKDIQLALADRNLYMSNRGKVKLLNRDYCDIEITSHRGDGGYPDNSLSAVRSAIHMGFDRIEVDMMKLRDDVWIANHDSYTGFSVIDSRGGNNKIPNYRYEQDYQYLRMKNSRTNEITKSPPPTAYSVFKSFTKHAADGQKLNIEIKGSYRESDLLALYNAALSRLGRGRFYFSSTDVNNLTTLRKVDQHLYLGFIQNPHPTSLSLLRNDVTKAVSSDLAYQSNQRLINRAVDRAMSYYSTGKSKDYTSSSSLALLQQKIGPHAGLHLDIRRYKETPHVTQRARSKGLEIHTYAVNGGKYHERILASLKPPEQIMSGVIVDSSPTEVCQRIYGGVSPKLAYKPVTKWGEAIQTLPDDADFLRMLEQHDYFNDGLYLTYNNQVKSFSIEIQSNKAAISSQPSSQGRKRSRQQDVDMGPLDTKTITIDLPPSE